MKAIFLLTSLCLLATPVVAQTPATTPGTTPAAKPAEAATTEPTATPAAPLPDAKAQDGTKEGAEAKEPGIRAMEILPERDADGRRKRIKKRDFRKLLKGELEIIESLENLHVDLARTQAELEKVRDERTRVEAELESFTKKYEEEKAGLAHHRTFVRKRLRALRVLARRETLSALFTSSTFTEYLRRERLLGRLLSQDRARLDGYKKALVHFRESTEELERRRNELADVERRIDESLARIERDRGDVREILRLIEEERDYYEKYHQELSRLSRLVRRKIGELEGWKGLAWFGAHKGKLAPPVRYATVAVPYGYRTHPRFRTKVLHRGHTYRPSRVPEGTHHLNVRAIYMGKVIFAGKLKGYGNTVILDHTKGFYTLYSRLSEITVKEGEVLQSRERLGILGRKTSLRKAELYFELRVDGKPVNPGPWLRD